MIALVHGFDTISLLYVQVVQIQGISTIEFNNDSRNI